MQKRVNIKNRYDKNLSAIIEVPEGEIKDFLIITHCFTCSKIYKLYSNISKILSQRGYGVVRYDVTGLGESEGDFSKTTFSTNVEDLVSMYDYVTSNYKEPRFLFGHSIGALVSIKATNILDSIKGVATVGGPSDFKNVIRLFSNYEERLMEKNNMVINLAGRDINIGLDYLEDVKGQNAEKIMNDFNKRIIIFHSNTDRTVSYEDGLSLFKAINSDKSFITLNNVDHLVSQKKDSDYIGDMLYSWLENF